MAAELLRERIGIAFMPDGRQISYAERGDLRGYPVIYQHGMPGSRLDQAAEDDVYRSLGIRLITPDRPGYGLSDPLPNRTLLDWPNDVAALADSLHLRRFAVLSLSGGGVYALACAAAIPERLSTVVAVGCPAPLDRAHSLRGMRFQNVIGLWLSARLPWLFAAVTDALAGTVRRYPGFFLDEGTHDHPAADRRWMSMPWVRAQATTNLREAFRQGASAYAQDIRLLLGPWGFAPEEIEKPVQLWHGDADTVIPLHHGKYLASTIKPATLHVCPGEGHMVMWSHIAEVLTATRIKSPFAIVRGGLALGSRPSGA